MFDLSRLSDAIGGLLGNTSLEQVPDLRSVVEQLSANGLDLSTLQNLAPAELTELLAQYNIDLGSFTPDQLSEFLSLPTDATGVMDTIGQFLERRG
jgi:hypothetical protein